MSHASRLAALFATVVITTTVAIASAQSRLPDAHVTLAVGERYRIPDPHTVAHGSDGVSRPYGPELDETGHLVLVGEYPGTGTVLIVLRDGTQRRYHVTVVPARSDTR